MQEYSKNTSVDKTHAMWVSSRTRGFQGIPHASRNCPTDSGVRAVRNSWAPVVQLSPGFGVVFRWDIERYRSISKPLKPFSPEKFLQNSWQSFEHWTLAMLKLTFEDLSKFTCEPNSTKCHTWKSKMQRLREMLRLLFRLFCRSLEDWLFGKSGQVAFAHILIVLHFSIFAKWGSDGARFAQLVSEGEAGGLCNINTLPHHFWNIQTLFKLCIIFVSAQLIPRLAQRFLNLQSWTKWQALLFWIFRFILMLPFHWILDSSFEIVQSCIL